MTTKRKSKKGTGQHVMSNEELKKLLVKEGLLSDEPVRNVVPITEKNDE